MSSASSVARRRFGPFGMLDVLLFAVPVAFALRFVPRWHNDTLLFIVAGIAIIPLAGWMGRATEHMAERAGPAVGGLLNATFGNAAELIIALMALSKGLTTVVKASITGSIIGNILLVLGASMLGGGLRFHTQKFNEAAARGGATSLSLAAMALVIPTVFHVTSNRSPKGWTPAAEQSLSLAIAVVMFVTYLCWLLFSLLTHKSLFAGDAPALTKAGHAHTESPPMEGGAWSMRKAVVVLAVATAFVALLSEFLVGSVEGARERLGLTEVFVGVIVVATIGNAAEHSTAVLLALKNKMDLSLGIAIGSSVQIALFVTPVLVFASYLFGQPMNLEFTLPEIAAVAMAVWTVVVISGDGESNWMEGVQLLSVYVILGLLFFFLPAGA